MYHLMNISQTINDIIKILSLQTNSEEMSKKLGIIWNYLAHYKYLIVIEKRLIMKIAEIKNIETKELVEKLEAAMTSIWAGT